MFFFLKKVPISVPSPCHSKRIGLDLDRLTLCSSSPDNGGGAKGLRETFSQVWLPGCLDTC